MVKIIGVRFKSVGKIYYFDPLDMEINVGDCVIVETARGIELGRVAIGIREVSEDSVVMPLRPVLRMASDEDLEMEAKNKAKEKEAFDICVDRIKKHGLEMKLVEVEYTFDGSKILFYFTADGRVDFRELVKDLAAVFKTRIELRQIGVRDETKALGGVGSCGRPLCCHSYLPEFIPVSIKMAKDQNLPLNPSKISGVCGRLMCCLKNEHETYEWLNSKCPNVGDVVKTNDGFTGEVSRVNILRQKVKVIINVGRDEKEVREYDVDDLTFTRGRKYRDEHEDDVNMAELKELEDDTEKEDDRGDRKEQSSGGYQKRSNYQNRGHRQNRGDSQESQDGQNRQERQSHQGHQNYQDRQSHGQHGHYQNDRSQGRRSYDKGKREYTDNRGNKKK